MDISRTSPLDRYEANIVICIDRGFLWPCGHAGCTSPQPVAIVSGRDSEQAKVNQYAVLYALSARARAQVFHPVGTSACTLRQAKSSCGGDGCATVIARAHAQLATHRLDKDLQPVNVFTHGLTPGLLTTLIHNAVAEQLPTRRGQPCTCELGDGSRRIHPASCGRRARSLQRWATPNSPRWLSDPVPDLRDRAVLFALAADLRSSSRRGGMQNYLAAAWQAVYGFEPEVSDLVAADRVRDLIDRVAAHTPRGDAAMHVEILAPLLERDGDTPLAFDSDRGGFHLEPAPSDIEIPDAISDPDARDHVFDDHDGNAVGDTELLDTRSSETSDAHVDPVERRYPGVAPTSSPDADPCEPSDEHIRVIAAYLELSPSQRSAVIDAVTELEIAVRHPSSGDLPAVAARLDDLQAVVEDLINLRPDITEPLTRLYNHYEEESHRAAVR